MKSRYLFLLTLSITLLLTLSGQVVSVSAEPTAQDSQICPPVIEEALAQLANNCGAMDVNSVCYGYRDVAATFIEPMPEDFFDQPSDLAPLQTIASLRTAAFNSVDNQWGVAMLKMRANIPNTLPGQALIFVLMGDVNLQNAVPVGEEFIQPDPLAVLSTGSANIRSGPGTTWNVISSVNGQSQLMTDGFSPDQNWMRVLVNDRYGWISTTLVDASTAPEIANLPVIDYERRAPMQAFTFQAGIGEPICGQAPNQLIVQGPEDTLVDLNVNGVDITIGSTVSFQQPSKNQMQMMVVEGSAYVNEDEYIPEGFTAVAPVEMFSEVGGSDEAEWTDIRPISSDELDSLESLEDISGDVLNYDLDVQDEPSDESELDDYEDYDYDDDDDYYGDDDDYEDEGDDDEYYEDDDYEGDEEYDEDDDYEDGEGDEEEYYGDDDDDYEGDDDDDSGGDDDDDSGGDDDDDE